MKNHKSKAVNHKRVRWGDYSNYLRNDGEIDYFMPRLVRQIEAIRKESQSFSVFK